MDKEHQDALGQVLANVGRLVIHAAKELTKKINDTKNQGGEFGFTDRHEALEMALRDTNTGLEKVETLFREDLVNRGLWEEINLPDRVRSPTTDPVACSQAGTSGPQPKGKSKGTCADRDTRLSVDLRAPAVLTEQDVLKRLGIQALPGDVLCQTSSVSKEEEVQDSERAEGEPGVADLCGEPESKKRKHVEDGPPWKRMKLPEVASA